MLSYGFSLRSYFLRMNLIYRTWKSSALFAWTPCKCLFFKLRLHLTKWTLEPTLSLFFFSLFLFQNGTVGPQHFNSSGLAETERDLHKLHLRCRAAKGFSSYDLNFRRLALLFSSRPPQFPPLKGIAIFASFLVSKMMWKNAKSATFDGMDRKWWRDRGQSPVSPFFNAHIQIRDMVNQTWWKIPKKVFRSHNYNPLFNAVSSIGFNSAARWRQILPELLPPPLVLCQAKEIRPTEFTVMNV